MNFVKKLDKWIPHKLTGENKLARLSIANSLIAPNRNDPFNDRIVTCDDKWVNDDNSRQSGSGLRQVNQVEPYRRKILLRRRFL